MYTEDMVKKFEKDVVRFSRLQRLLIATDQWFAVLLWNTSQDETISGHIGRRIRDGKATKFDKFICKILRKIDNKHCIRSIGE